MLFVAYLSAGFSAWLCQADLWTLACRAECRGCVYLHRPPTVAASLRQLVLLPLEHELKHGLAITTKLFSDKAVSNSNQSRSRVNGGGLKNVQD